MLNLVKSNKNGNYNPNLVSFNKIYWSVRGEFCNGICPGLKYPGWEFSRRNGRAAKRSTGEIVSSPDKRLLLLFFLRNTLRKMRRKMK